MGSNHAFMKDSFENTSGYVTQSPVILKASLSHQKPPNDHYSDLRLEKLVGAGIDARRKGVFDTPPPVPLHLRGADEEGRGAPPPFLIPFLRKSGSK